MAYPKYAPNTLANVHVPAIFHAFFGVANIMGMSIISGGIGKKELSINDIKNNQYKAYLDADKPITES